MKNHICIIIKIIIACKTLLQGIEVYIYNFERIPLNTTDTNRLATTTIKYFSLFGLKVCIGASDDPEVVIPVWQLGSANYLHVMEFSSQIKLWHWWRERITYLENSYNVSDEFFRFVERRPGWTRRALEFNFVLADQD
ncbi:hypothetical protein [Xanthomonas vesicatoria]|uniref:hypothetical protein n=1 Tax=Xanthomonas vesicatoria TaxID=56460 RepID=UPI001E346898|nr:hypothetical protein [Xanthomonas vesicatoria]MCC8626451.1 hypothetical protein [Xanthomonas vesicatoria]MDG4481805.1 hypothetical protein [Xanthomonas vesicatoria]